MSCSSPPPFSLPLQIQQQERGGEEYSTSKPSLCFHTAQQLEPEPKPELELELELELKLEPRGCSGAAACPILSSSLLMSSGGWGVKRDEGGEEQQWCLKAGTPCSTTPTSRHADRATSTGGVHSRSCMYMLKSFESSVCTWHTTKAGCSYATVPLLDPSLCKREC